MKAGKLFQEHRSKILVLVVALGLFAIFHQAIIAWFTGAPVGSVVTGQAVTASAGALEVEAALRPDPPRQNNNVLELSLRNANGDPVDDGEIDVTYLMPAMGSMQEMRGRAVIEAKGDGRYEASFDVPMTGSWSLIVDIKGKDSASQVTFGMTVGSRGLRLTGGVAAEREVQHDHLDDEIAHYTCSMHPSVKQESPGTCPICSMDLTPVSKTEVETGTIFVDEVRRQRIGVRTAPVELQQLTLRIRAVGKVQYDETKLSDVNLRMSGWVQRLMVEETGQRVRRGQTLFTLYSPELYAAQLEYLTSVRRQNDASSETFANLTRASRNRLRLLGMTDAQIRRLEKRGEARENVPVLAPASGYVIEKNVVEGARIEAGTRVYRIADLSEVWIEAEVYESDLPHVELEQHVRVELPYVPDRTFEGRVEYIYPTLESATRTGRVRVVLRNPGLELKPNMYANVELEVDLEERLVIPDSAVIYTGPRRLVFVDLGEGRLQPKEVKLGLHAGGYYEVTEGLESGEIVVTSGNFLIAAESRIRSAAKYWEASDESR